MRNIEIDNLHFYVYYGTLEKAKRIALSNAIQIINIEGEDNDEICIEALVEGSESEPYETSIYYDGNTGLIRRYRCTCKAVGTYYGLCKHCAALAIQVHNKQVKNEINVNEIKYKTNNRLMKLMKQQTMMQAQAYLEGGVEGIIELEPRFHYDSKEWTVDFKIGTIDKKYVVKDINLLCTLVNNIEYYSYGKKLAFIHSRSAFTERGLKLFDFIQTHVTESEGYNKLYNRSSNDYQTIRRIALSQSSLIELLKLYTNTQIYMNDELAWVIDEVPNLQCELNKKGLNWVLKLPNLICIRNSEEAYLFHQNFYHLPLDYPLAALDLFELCEGEACEFKIDEADLPAFCSSLLPALETTTQITKPSALEEFRPIPCSIKFYLDQLEKGDIKYIICKPFAVYGEEEYNLFKELKTDGIIHRDVVKETQTLFSLMQYFPMKEKEFAYIGWDDEEAVYKLISTGLDQLRQLGEVFLSSSIRKLVVARPPKVHVNVSLNVGLLNIDIDTKLPSGELEQLLNSYKQRKKYYRLSNGSFIQLEDSSLSALAELTEGLELNTKQLESGHLQLPKYHALYINQVLKDNEAELDAKRNYDFRQIIKNLSNVENSDYECPKDLKAELRPYQMFGYQWLRTLENLGFGAILADDMGLGKTIQVITFLLGKVHETAVEGKPVKALIVCPASLVYNWESEINRFAPYLTVCTIVGNSEQRKVLIEKQNQYDITLTSYDLLKRDIDLYKEYRFDYEIIDEAQNIKNYTTQASKAVKAIQATTRFALTGTPIENSLSELWSIFDFILPGLLGSYQKFKKKYENPIIANNEEVSQRLQKIVKPFILRRLKKDVLKELPDKIEKVILAKMDQEQERLYTANAQRVIDTLAKKSDDEFNKSRIQILAELTKLRQLCCDPSLVYENYQGSSAKLNACMDIVDSAIDAGNKVLIFSQFTSMLDIIKAELERRNIDAFVLTGATSKEKRRELVDRFNKDQTPVFLISLKAGGTGLNLTSASIVIHYDPWWNLAAQNQATDRTHRIGQKQVVTVYKLLIKDTIEERIELLQEKKAQLSDQIISDGGITQDVMSKSDFMDVLSLVKD